MRRDRDALTVEGVLLAGLGFGLSRFAVAEALQTDGTLPYLLVGMVPLVVSLGLACFGVAIAVGTVSRSYARSVTLWAFGGTAAIQLIILVTAVNAFTRGEPLAARLGSDLFLANVLLGGAVGGAILGDRIERTRRSSRRLERRAEWGLVTNRVLRHDILNAATVIRGYATLPSERRETLEVDALETAADRIHETVERVSSFAPGIERRSRAIDLSAIVASVAEETDVELSTPETTIVPGDDGIEMMLRELVDTLSAHRTGDASMEIAVGRQDDAANVRLHAPGVELDEGELEQLGTGALPEYDDPKTGFGFQIVRLFADRYDADITIDRHPTVVTITFPRAGTSGAVTRITRADALIAAAVAILAGLCMGIYLELAAGLMPIIGSLYTVPNAVVGWITHLFHSVVFALLFAAGLTLPRSRSVVGPGAHTLLGIGWGVVIWLVAAGIVMPIWLGLVGIDASIPNLSGVGLVGHAIWGAILGAGYWFVRWWSLDDPGTRIFLP